MTQLLVIEDDIDIRDLVTFKLEQLGYDVRTASDGVSGLDLAAEVTPDLVVLDILMPKMSGFEVCRELHARNATARTPIIILTAKAQEADIEQRLRARRDRLHREAVQPTRVREPCPCCSGT